MSGAILLVTLGATLGDPATRDAPAAVGAVVVALAVTLRRTRPAAGVVIAVVAQGLDAALGGQLAVSTATLPAMLLLAGSLGRHAATPELVGGLAVLLGAALLDAVLATDGFLNELAFDVVIAVALPVAAGRVLRRRAELVDELRRQRAQLERERDRRAESAAVAERVRVARELHDVVVHDVSAMVVQATAARLAVHGRPGEAVDAIRRIEGAGREALDELRRALGVLRADDRAPALEPQPSFAQLDALARAAADRDATVIVALDAAPGRLPADLQLAACRIVEEILAGPPPASGRVEVAIRHDGAALRVEVARDGPPRPPEELVATRARVALFGGSLDAGPRAGGGSRVCARLLLPVPAA